MTLYICYLFIVIVQFFYAQNVLFHFHTYFRYRSNCIILGSYMYSSITTCSYLYPSPDACVLLKIERFCACVEESTRVFYITGKYVKKEQSHFYVSLFSLVVLSNFCQFPSCNPFYTDMRIPLKYHLYSFYSIYDWLYHLYSLYSMYDLLPLLAHGYYVQNSSIT